MSSDELRAAADLYRSVGPFDHISEEAMDRFLEARAILADAWIAEHPADDGEAIGLGFLLSLPCGPIDVSMGDIEAVAFGNGWLIRREGSRWQFFLGGGVFLRMLDGRGQVRRLLSALGVNLTEQPTPAATAASVEGTVPDAR